MTTSSRSMSLGFQVLGTSMRLCSGVSQTQELEKGSSRDQPQFHTVGPPLTVKKVAVTQPNGCRAEAYHCTYLKNGWSPNLKTGYYLIKRVRLYSRRAADCGDEPLRTFPKPLSGGLQKVCTDTFLLGYEFGLVPALKNCKYRPLRLGFNIGSFY